MVLSPLQKALQHMQESFDDAILHMNGVSSGTGERGFAWPQLKRLTS